MCATASRRIHSRYIRHVADLPSAGRKVRLRLLTRRFTCEVPHCQADRHEEGKGPIARKIAIVLHCIWADGTSFDWGQPKPI
ncbi:transposase family protein [Bradyrhizobium sp. 182]|nr:transposase family protein [Bradyrhizobium sp. 182]MCK1531455.1 transposase family protein [Bradyrhizobium sp. 182]